MLCAFCKTTIPAKPAPEGRKAAPGRKAAYCDETCRRGGEALATLERLLPVKPQAILVTMERIEATSVDMGALSDDVLRRLRASAFTVASRGRKLQPGSSPDGTRASARPRAT